VVRSVRSPQSAVRSPKRSPSSYCIPLQSSGGADERALIDRVKRGDTAAYDELVRRYLRRAMTIARRLLDDAEDAEDLVQDAFMRALDRIRGFDSEREFGPWFFRLLVNTGLNARKARAVRATEAVSASASSPSALPDELLERKEIRDRFAAALDALPPRQRLIVSMFEADGLSTAEIAHALGITPETVRWHHHQARQKLRELLADFRE